MGFQSYRSFIAMFWFMGNHYSSIKIMQLVRILFCWDHGKKCHVWWRCPYYRLPSFYQLLYSLQPASPCIKETNVLVPSRCYYYRYWCEQNGWRTGEEYTKQAGGRTVTVWGNRESNTWLHSSIKCGIILDQIPDIPSRALKRQQNSWSSSSSLDCLAWNCGCLAALLYSSCFETSLILSRKVSRPNRFSTSCRNFSCIQLSYNNFRDMLADEVILNIQWSFLTGIKYEGPGYSQVTLCPIIPLSSNMYSSHAY